MLAAPLLLLLDAEEDDEEGPDAEEHAAREEPHSDHDHLRAARVQFAKLAWARLACHLSALDASGEPSGR